MFFIRPLRALVLFYTVKNESRPATFPLSGAGLVSDQVGARSACFARELVPGSHSRHDQVQDLRAVARRPEEKLSDGERTPTAKQQTQKCHRIIYCVWSFGPPMETLLIGFHYFSCSFVVAVFFVFWIWYFFFLFLEIFRGRVPGKFCSMATAS